MTYYLCGTCHTVWHDSHDTRCDCSHCGSSAQYDIEILKKMGLVKQE